MVLHPPPWAHTSCSGHSPSRPWRGHGTALLPAFPTAAWCICRGYTFRSGHPPSRPQHGRGSTLPYSQPSQKTAAWCIHRGRTSPADDGLTTPSSAWSQQNSALLPALRKDSPKVHPPSRGTSSSGHPPSRPRRGPGSTPPRSQLCPRTVAWCSHRECTSCSGRPPSHPWHGHRSTLCLAPSLVEGRPRGEALVVTFPRHRAVLGVQCQKSSLSGCQTRKMGRIALPLFLVLPNRHMFLRLFPARDRVVSCRHAARPASPLEPLERKHTRKETRIICREKVREGLRCVCEV